MSINLLQIHLAKTNTHLLRLRRYHTTTTKAAISKKSKTTMGTMYNIHDIFASFPTDGGVNLLEDDVGDDVDDDVGDGVGDDVAMFNVF